MADEVVTIVRSQILTFLDDFKFYENAPHCAFYHGCCLGLAANSCGLEAYNGKLKVFQEYKHKVIGDFVQSIAKFMLSLSFMRDPSVLGYLQVSLQASPSFDAFRYGYFIYQHHKTVRNFFVIRDPLDYDTILGVINFVLKTIIDPTDPKKRVRDPAITELRDQAYAEVCWTKYKTMSFSCFTDYSKFLKIVKVLEWKTDFNDLGPSCFSNYKGLPTCCCIYYCNDGVCSCQIALGLSLPHLNVKKSILDDMPPDARSDGSLIAPARLAGRPKAGVIKRGAK